MNRKWFTFATLILVAVVYATINLTAIYVCSYSFPVSEKIFFQYLGQNRYLDPSQVSRFWDLLVLPLFARIMFSAIPLAKNNNENGIFIKRQYKVFGIFPMIIYGLIFAAAISISIISGFPLSKQIGSDLFEALGEIGVIVMYASLLIGGIFSLILLISERIKDEKLLEKPLKVLSKGLEPLVFLSLGTSVIGIFAGPIILNMTCGVFLALCIIACTMIGSFLPKVAIIFLYWVVRTIEKIDKFLDKKRKENKSKKEKKRESTSKSQ